MAKTEKPLPKALTSGGFIPIPRQFLTLIPKELVSGLTQLMLVVVIQAETDGHVDRREYAIGLTAKKLAPLCGCDIKADSKHIEKSLADLARRGIIERVKDGRGWKYRNLYAQWSQALKYERALDEAGEPESEELAAEEVAIEHVPVEKPLILKPGAHSRPFTIPPQAKQFSWENKSSAASLRFEASLAANGVLTLCANDAIDRGTAAPLSDKATPKNQQVSAAKIPKSAKPAADPVRDLVNDWCLDRGCSVITENKLREVKEALNGTPVSYLDQVARQAKNKIRAAGIFVNFAQEATANYEEVARRDRAKPAAPKTADDGQKLAAHRANWSAYDAEERKIVKKGYGAEAFADLE